MFRCGLYLHSWGHLGTAEAGAGFGRSRDAALMSSLLRLFQQPLGPYLCVKLFGGFFHGGEHL